MITPAPGLPTSPGPRRWQPFFADVAILDQHREHELDLLVAWPGVGLAAIETKGGHIARRDGVWHQGRPPHSHRIDPFRQVQDARHALTRWLANHGAAPTARARTAHLVAFPHTRIPADWHTPEAPRATILDRDDLPGAATAIRHAIEQHGAGHAPLTSADVDTLVGLLAGSNADRSTQLREVPPHGSVISARRAATSIT